MGLLLLPNRFQRERDKMCKKQQYTGKLSLSWRTHPIGPNPKCSQEEESTFCLWKWCSTKCKQWNGHTWEGKRWVWLTWYWPWRLASNSNTWWFDWVEALGSVSADQTIRTVWLTLRPWTSEQSCRTAQLTKSQSWNARGCTFLLSYLHFLFLLRSLRQEWLF